MCSHCLTIAPKRRRSGASFLHRDRRIKPDAVAVCSEVWLRQHHPSDDPILRARSFVANQPTVRLPASVHRTHSSQKYSNYGSANHHSALELALFSVLCICTRAVRKNERFSELL